MAVFAARQGFALGLGDVKVSSYLGEPLKAQVEFVDLSDDYEANLKVRLASSDEYKKNGYIYPSNLKLKFVVASENGKQAIVRISSSQVVEDPFLTLLLEVSSSSGKFIKIYTVLIDPEPEILQKPTASTTLQILPNPDTVKASSVNSSALPHTSSKVASKHNFPANQEQEPPPHRSVLRRIQDERVVPSTERRMVSSFVPTDLLSNKLSLSLSTSLSISRSDPALKGKVNSDALQEELIAKEKTLSDLNLRISELHSLISDLQQKLKLTEAMSGVMASSGVLSTPASASLAVASKASSVVNVKAAPLKGKQNEPMTDQLFHATESYFKVMAAVLLVAILGLVSFVIRRKRNAPTIRNEPGLFDDISHADKILKDDLTDDRSIISNHQFKPTATSPILIKTLSGEQSIKVPAYKEAGKPQSSTVAPEYDLLEEADIYLRFGHDKLAEEVLRDALKINASNPEIYMSLLGIFDTRGDPRGFQEVALELKKFADDATWQKAAKMGKRLDVANALYQ